MSWYSKVFWSEGLFLRPHHLQQNDRYVEHLLERRVGQVTPYPWGFSSLEIDRDLAQQSKFSLRRASGVMPDGRPFKDSVHFKRVLLEGRDKFLHAFVEHLCTYALRRVLTVDDRESISAIVEEAKKNKYGLKDIVRAVALSDLIRKR